MLLLALKKFKFYALSPCHQPLVALGQKMVEMTLRETVGTICPREREGVKLREILGRKSGGDPINARQRQQISLERAFRREI